ncbi:YggS family pyridoxal phosphate-dependent enzyme [Cellulosimicrobium arenosum]|uniref:Pyridoxal phosphate homeostasis protein n=1 Tax=Cellulosimicrobium arenosum TaxID=2708133 RepID=A0A927PGF4_9MICO|nr:YggS family pyridoxal phosphate-dependent enzyme [Cellulosimicrobium arenosum]MBD8080432.1 YggS family pyridoxal phosphate-dependent enzyme [Cellulosimicrobium arenosum]
MPSSSPDLLTLVTENVRAVRARIDGAARGAGRDPSDVRLLVATKTQPPEAVRAVVAAGVELVGENRVQELVAKAPAIADLVAAGDVAVHMIGNLQRNKVNQVLATASAVQSVDSLAIAEALSSRCVRDTLTIDVMVQVNVSGEASKSGVEPDDAPGLAREVAALPGVRLTGFMTIGARSRDDDEVRAGFARLREVRDVVVRAGDPRTRDARELSMGMSGDLELAVAEGATIVRVGTAVLGSRPAP